MAQTQFSIEKLKATVGEFAKGNRYNVLIEAPNFPFPVNMPNTLQYLCVHHRK